MGKDYSNVMIPVFVSEDILSFERLFELTWTKLDRDYLGRTCDKEISFIVAADKENFFYAAQTTLSPDFDSDPIPGKYFEGLWTKDVASVFMRENASNQYQEFEISPNGAWWSMAFEKPRDRLLNQFRMPSAETIAMRIGDGWRAGFKMKRSELTINFDFKKGSALNFCAVLGQGPRTYMSYSIMPGEKPNFHQPTCFVPAMFVKI